MCYTIHSFIFATDNKLYMSCADCSEFSRNLYAQELGNLHVYNKND